MMSPHEFARLIDAHGPALVLYARQWCAAPEDVVQEAFLKLIRLTESPHDAAAWLHCVVRNAAIDSGKTSRRRHQREAAVARPETWFAEAQMDGLDAEAAVTALEKLPLEQREPIVAHLWSGLSFEQIAELTGCSTSTAFRRFTAGITELRKELGVPCPTQSRTV
jgi:RNA polymerase sigma-70 factor (ECF subfamily)